MRNKTKLSECDGIRLWDVDEVEEAKVVVYMYATVHV